MKVVKSIVRNPENKRLPKQVRKAIRAAQRRQEKADKKAARKAQRELERAAEKQSKEDMEKDFHAYNNGYFEWAGTKLLRPTQGLSVMDETRGVYSDSLIPGFEMDKQAVELNYKNGDYLVVLRLYNATEDLKYMALTVTTEAIIKAREQRLRLHFVDGTEAVCKLVREALENAGEKIDKRLKDPQKIVDKYKEKFLSLYSHEQIMLDIERVINTL